MLRHGYEIGLEWCGYATKRHVVRQYGEWVAQFETRGAAIDCIADRNGVLVGQTETLTKENDEHT